MKVKVIYPSDGSQEKSRIEFFVETPKPTTPTPLGEDCEYILSQVWRLANFVEASDQQRFRDYAEQNGVKAIRSMMVGDIAAFEDGRYYVCENIGWKEVDEQFIKHWESLDSGTRLMGVKYYLKYPERRATHEQ